MNTLFCLIPFTRELLFENISVFNICARRQKTTVLALMVVVWEMEVIYSKMLGGFVWNHSHAAKVEICSWGWRLTSHPSPPHPFAYLVSVRRRCVERLEPLQVCFVNWDFGSDFLRSTQCVAYVQSACFQGASVCIKAKWLVPRQSNTLMDSCLYVCWPLDPNFVVDWSNKH